MRSAFVATLLLFTCAGFAGKKDLRSPQKFRLERSYAIKNKSATEALAMRVFIPDVISYQNARVLQSEYSIQFMEKKPLPNGTEQLTFDLELAPAEEKKIRLQWHIELRGFNATAAPGAAELSGADRERYLKPGKYFESDNAEIAKKTGDIVAGQPNDFQKARAIFEFVRAHVAYERFGADTKGALYALKNRKGDCTEYAALIVAMSRAAGIPARLNGVMNLQNDNGSAGTDNHNHAEVYLADYGWVPAEATFKSLEFGEMHNAEIIVRRGLWTDTGTGWVSWSIPKKSDKIKEIKLLGHRWQKLD